MYLTQQPKADNFTMARRGRKDLDKSGNAYFITTTVMNFLNIFSLGDQYYDVVISSLKYLLNEHKIEKYLFLIFLLFQK